ncbi:MAG: hypothetical protein K4H23_05455 [Mollicutes bacterium PWAP]|nr:hypothetical protein [Mollicutes bacterium PWAP]
MNKGKINKNNPFVIDENYVLRNSEIINGNFVITEDTINKVIEQIKGNIKEIGKLYWDYDIFKNGYIDISWNSAKIYVKFRNMEKEIDIHA